MTADRDWLAQIHAECFSIPRPWSANEFGVLLKSNGVTLVGRQEGFVLARAVLDEAEILTIAVRPALQKRGIGRELLDQIAQKLANDGAKYLFLEVSAENAPALALYYSSGFQESGRRTGYYRSSGTGAEDALILSKTIG